MTQPLSVEYLGRIYERTYNIEGCWYFEDFAVGAVRPFEFQDKVRVLARGDSNSEPAV